MAFCPNCGTEVQGRFCAKCGSPVEAAPQQPQPQAPPQGYTAPPGGYTPPPGYTAPPPGGYQPPPPGYQPPPPGGYPPPPPGGFAPQSAGLTDNMAAALCYLLGVLTGILFLVLAPYNQNRAIRFHAFQSIFFWVAAVAAFIVASIASLILLPIPFLGAMLSLVLHLAVWFGTMIIWVMLMYKAYNNERWVLPVIGPLAEKQA